MGNMIGSGIYLLPASLAPYGWNALFGWCLTITGGLFLAAVFARLAAMLPAEGGPYAYTRAAFGPLPSFTVAWSFWVTYWVGNAAIAIAGVSYLGYFLPVLGREPLAGAAAALGAVWLLTGVNLMSVGAAGRVQIVATLLKLAPLAAVLLVGVLLVRDGAPAAPFEASTITLGGVSASASLTLWALLAFESATVPADAVANPRRTIPRATMIGMALTGLGYLAISTVILAFMPADEAARSGAPIAEFIAAHLGREAGLAVAAFAAISCFGALNGCILVQGETACAMARGAVFPRWLGALSSAGVPVRAHLVSSLLLTLVILANFTRGLGGLFTFLALVATIASLVAYLACSLALMRLDRRRAVALIAVPGAVYSAWTLWGAGREAILWGAVLILAGLPIYFAVRRGSRLRPAA